MFLGAALLFISINCGLTGGAGIESFREFNPERNFIVFGVLHLALFGGTGFEGSGVD
jgi:hypothetical protein